MGQPGRHDPKRGRVSGLRFRRLIRIEDRDELYPHLIRVLGLLDLRTDVVALARDVYLWNEPTRKRWAYDYYAQAPDAADSKAA